MPEANTEHFWDKLREWCFFCRWCHHPTKQLQKMHVSRNLPGTVFHASWRGVPKARPSPTTVREQRIGWVFQLRTMVAASSSLGPYWDKCSNSQEYVLSSNINTSRKVLCQKSHMFLLKDTYPLSIIEVEDDFQQDTFCVPGKVNWVHR